MASSIMAVSTVRLGTARLRWKRTVLISVLCLIALLSAGTNTTHAQPGPGSATKATTLNLEGVDIKELVRWIAKLTGKNIILHPAVKGEVTLISGEPLTPEEAYRVFLSVLQVHGLAVIEADDALKVVPIEAMNQGGAPIAQGAKDARFGEDVVVRVVRIRNVAATQVANALKPLMPQSALVLSYPDTNLLILSDRAANIVRLEEIITRIDLAGSVDIEVVTLQYATAAEVLSTIQSVLPGGSRPDAQGFTLASDARSNSILLGGNPAARAPLRALIRRLDKPKASEGNTHLVYLDYANPTTLVPILTNLTSQEARGNLDRTLRDAPVRIEALADRNALVITAPPPVFASLKSLIAELDTRRTQVLVEAIIVEVNTEDLSDLGIQWRSRVPNDDGTFGAIGLLPGGLPTGAPPEVGGGLTLSVFHDGGMRGLVRALASDANANLLSTPTLVTLDNVEAEILVGENVPFITGNSTGPASSTASPFQTIERHDIGVTLKVKPRVNRDNAILLTIEQTVEAVADSAAATADIVTSKRSISTQVLIENDSVLVLGGLIRDDISQKQSKVPLLGNIPVVGRAFRSTSNQIMKKNLMVFIHPRILRNPADAAFVTAERYQLLQSLQERSNDRADHFLIPGAPLPALPALPETAVPESSPTATESP